MLVDLGAALAKDPQLRKWFSSTQINRKDFHVDFNKVDPTSDFKKFHKKLRTDFEKDRFQTEPVDMGMTLMEVLKQKEAKNMEERANKGVPKLELFEQTSQIMQKLGAFKINKDSFDSPVKLQKNQDSEHQL
jgi:hypothetical protein